MRNARIMIAALWIGAQGACATGAPGYAAGPVDFAWGCWVSKQEAGGPPSAFLRLLKDGVDGQFYAGHFHTAANNTMTLELHLSIARDGSRAIVSEGGQTYEFLASPPDGSQLPDGYRAALFAEFTPGQPGAVSLLGSAENLKVVIMTASGGGRMFEGERDGCD